MNARIIIALLLSTAFCGAAYPQQFVQTPALKNARAGEPEKPFVTRVSTPAAAGREAANMENVKVLPKPESTKGMALEKAIAIRRSVRNFAARDLSIEQISQLLWAAQGITDENNKFRAAPSAGGLYPMEIYIVSSSGTYHYVPDGHKIEILKTKDQRQELSDACGGQEFVAEAALDVIIVAVYGRTTWRYGNRGIKYVDMEAGHVAQNIHLQAVSLGLGSVPVGAFNDDMVKKVLGLSAEQQPVYVIPVGYPK
jgi:SagB-type dehydrogenase family enzyme